jgi:2-phosphoglycolate phosphatase
MPKAVLFDFDGTLADTAADLGGALNAMRAARGLAALPIEDMRPYASSGARGLLRAGFDMTPEHPDYLAMRADFLERYERDICVHTKLFDGIPQVLAELVSRGMAWGIVTNKSKRLTALVVEALAPSPAPSCVVSGDTTPHMKPHPAPLLHAAEALGMPPQDCWYLGDDLRDIQAARAAGMRSVAVAYGYGGARTHTWEADHVIERPQDLIPLL